MPPSDKQFWIELYNNFLSLVFFEMSAVCEFFYATGCKTIEQYCQD